MLLFLGFCKHIKVSLLNIIDFDLTQSGGLDFCNKLVCLSLASIASLV